MQYCSGATDPHDREDVSPALAQLIHVFADVEPASPVRNALETWCSLRKGICDHTSPCAADRGYRQAPAVASKFERKEKMCPETYLKYDFYTTQHNCDDSTIAKPAPSHSGQIMHTDCGSIASNVRRSFGDSRAGIGVTMRLRNHASMVDQSAFKNATNGCISYNHLQQLHVLKLLDRSRSKVQAISMHCPLPP